MITFNAVTLAQVSFSSQHNSIRIHGLQAKFWPHFFPLFKILHWLLTEYWKVQTPWGCLLLVCSVQFTRSFMSDSLQPHELQHARPPCPSPTPRVHPNSYPLSWWCHPTISSSVVPFVSCPQSFPASGSFPMSQFFTSGGRSIGVSASASSLPIQDWYL